MFVIAGFGFVGKAYYSVFGQHFNFEIVDPKYNDLKLEHIKHVEGVICCVSTPSTDTGKCDVSSVIDVISKTPVGVPILIKSTIDLEAWDKIKKTYPKHNITFSPEFLRAENSTTDLRETSRVILAGDQVDFWKKFYLSVLTTVQIDIFTIPEAILIKYFVNSFLATKVSFFNQIYDLCQQSGIDYENVRQGISDDYRIGHSHTCVTAERGWGGYCFPKDTKALLNLAKNYQTKLSILDVACEYNSQIRKFV